MAVFSLCLITLLGASNSSYGLTRLAFVRSCDLRSTDGQFVWPIVILAVLIRMIAMIFMLNQRKDRITFVGL